MNDLSSSAPSPATPVSSVAPPPASRTSRAIWVFLIVFAVLAVGGAVLAWKADQRVATLEQELVRRQQESANKSVEAQMLAKQAQQTATDTTAKVALLEARVAEVAVQRGQLEDLIQSLSRSRDENVLGDVESAIRVAMQQSAITGSAEPLVATLRQADDRLARYNQPRLDGVRRAIARDLDRVKSTNVADISTLGIKLDEAVRMVDDLPLIASAEARAESRNEPKAREAARAAAAASATTRTVPARGSAASAAAAVASASAPEPAPVLWTTRVNETLAEFGSAAWSEARSLLRVTRIDNPDAMLIAPDQAFFVRENLKLRLLNARLALLSRQFETAQGDLQVAQASLDRYFDRTNKRTVAAGELVKQVAAQSRLVGVPRPDDTLAALTAVAAGR